MTADQLAVLFLQVIKLHGIPEDLVSDRDKLFTSSFWKHLMSKLGTKLKMSTAFHPQTDGQTERTNSTLEQVLRAYIGYDQQNWEEWLPFVEFAINNASQDSTGRSPFFINYGYHPRVPSTLPSVDSVPAVQDFHSQLYELQDQVSRALKRASDRQSKAANQHRQSATFQVGDQVMLDIRNLAVRRPSEKLDFKYSGPFRIIRVANSKGTAYELDLPPQMFKLWPVFHVSLLEPYVASDPSVPRSDPPPPPDIIDGEEEYEVEQLLDRRGSGRSLEYLVHFAGYPIHLAEWTPISNLLNANELVKSFDSTFTPRRRLQRRPRSFK